MKKLFHSFTAFLICLTVFNCQDHRLEPIPEPTQFQVSNFVGGLKSPIGMAIDDKGQIWVTENGAGNNDGQISVISPTGTVHQGIIGFRSIISPEDGLPAGLTHLIYKEGKLYILHAVDGKLYTADIANFIAGNPPMAAAVLPSEDLRSFVLSQNLSNPLNSNLFNLTFGPEGDLYITDAGANAIIRRNSSSKALSVFAKIPNLNPMTEPVPTGIVYDGSKFLVSGLGGFPFTDGATKIYQVDASGNVTDFKTGYTNLTDIVLTANKKPLVLQFAKFVFNPPANVGFQPMTGQILNENGTVLLKDLMMPTSIQRSGDRTYFVLSLALGTIQKLTY